VSPACDGCTALARERRDWANELGNYAQLLALAADRENWGSVEAVIDRVLELRRRIGGGL
jgi:hypothetical protein